MINTVEIIIWIVLFIWLSFLSFLALKNFLFFRRLSKNTKEVDIRKALDKVVAHHLKNSSDIVLLQREIAKIKEFNFDNIQKFSLVRFNPFREIGGDHSFSMVLLDGRNNGMVLTALHTRDRTRVYSKEIKNGKGEIELSDEEKKALLKACKN